MTENTSSSTTVGFYSLAELKTLQEKGVTIPAPEHVCISKDVNLENIAAGVVIHPFARISGSKTRIDSDTQIGSGGSVIVQNSVIGADANIGNLGGVTLKNVTAGAKTVLGAGVAEDAVFLGREFQSNAFTTGFGFRARKGSLYEEDVCSAQHTDTKMTLLFPWATLGSNINFCDLLLSGGTGGRSGEFSEVGSGTIHFNFTLRGDKATGSLLGDVTRGVFLREPRLFIGGNNSLIGPLSSQFGAFTAAGVRALGNLKTGLNLGSGLAPGHRDYDARVFSRPLRVIENQVTYIGELIALYHWYNHVRIQIVAQTPQQKELYEAGQKIVLMNIKERIHQMGHLIDLLEDSARILHSRSYPPKQNLEEHHFLISQWPSIEKHLLDYENHVWPLPETLQEDIQAKTKEHKGRYLRTIQTLSDSSLEFGHSWLASIVHRSEHFLKNKHNEFLK